MYTSLFLGDFSTNTISSVILSGVTYLGVISTGVISTGVTTLGIITGVTTLVSRFVHMSDVWVLGDCMVWGNLVGKGGNLGTLDDL